MPLAYPKKEISRSNLDQFTDFFKSRYALKKNLDQFTAIDQGFPIDQGFFGPSRITQGFFFASRIDQGFRARAASN